MVAIAPFRALRYNPSKVALESVTSPPHDCIPDSQTARYLDDALGIAHIVLAKRQGGDAVELAAEHLRQWQAEGTMVRDGEPAFYLYALTRTNRHGERKTMHGLFCRVALDPTYTEIQRHEHILPRKKEERYALRAALECDPEPIWMLYRDQRAWVEEILRSNAYDELLNFVDEAGERHRIWRIDRPQAVEEVIAQFDDRTLVIADGHHRYQTALDHHANTGKPGHDSILVCLVRDDDPGVGLVATHRLLTNTTHESLSDFTAGLNVTPLDGPRESWLEAVNEHTIVLVGDAGGAPAACTYTLPRPDDGSCLAGLAVTRTHQLLNAHWGVDPKKPEEHLEFTRDAAEAIAQVAPGTLAILLPPEGVADVLEVAKQGDVMPQKSTYFVPKLRSGLVLSPLDEPKPKGWLGQVAGPGKADFRMPPL